MSIYKKEIINLSSNQLTDNIFKQNIFKGKIIIIKKAAEILKILETTERYFHENEAR